MTGIPCSMYLVTCASAMMLLLSLKEHSGCLLDCYPENLYQLCETCLCCICIFVLHSICYQARSKMTLQFASVPGYSYHLNDEIRIKYGSKGNEVSHCCSSSAGLDNNEACISIRHGLPREVSSRIIFKPL